MKPKQRDGLGKQCVCPVATWPKCQHSWRLTFWWIGKPWKITLDVHLKHHPDSRWPGGHVATRTEAQTLADEIRSAIRAGVYVVKPRANQALTEPESAVADLTFAQLVDRFVTGKLEKLNIDTWTDERGRLKRMAAVNLPDLNCPFGALKVAAITDTHIEDVYELVTEGLAHGTRRKYRRGIKRIFRWAAAKQLILEHGVAKASPITEDTTLPADPGTIRQKRIRPELEAALLHAATEMRQDVCSRLAALIIAAIDTGARRGELLAIKAGDVFLDEGYILIRAIERGSRKSKKPRKVPITPRLRVVLEPLLISPTGLPFHAGAYVFGDAIGGRVQSIRKGWDTVVLRAHGVNAEWTTTGALTPAVREALRRCDLHFHDLRHEAALRWHEAGVELNAIATLLGHADLGQLRIYLGIAGDDAVVAHRTAFEALEAEQVAAGLQPEIVTVRGRDGRVTSTRTLPNRPISVLFSKARSSRSGNKTG